MSSEKLTREQIKRIVEEVVDQVVGTEEQYQKQERDFLDRMRTWYVGNFSDSQHNTKAYVEISENGYKLSCNGDAVLLFVILKLGMIEALKLRYSIDGDKFSCDINELIKKYLVDKKQEV